MVIDLTHEPVSEDRARRIIQNGTKQVTDSDIEKVLNREQDIAGRFRGPLGRFVNDGRTLLDMVKDYWKKNYTETPWWTIGAAVTALLYVLNPMDIVPDFIPVVGLLDDATVLSVCMYMLEQDVSKYRRWHSGKPLEEKGEGGEE